MPRCVIASFLIAAMAAAAAPAQDADLLHKAAAYDADALAALFDRYYEAGKSYYENGRRAEAVWCFKRSLELRPELGALKRFVDLLQDFDNPVWRRKKWKSPRESVDAAFRRKQASLDGDLLERWLYLGAHHGKDDAAVLQRRALDYFRKALWLAGGPYATDRQGRVLVGKAGPIPEPWSARLLAEDLVTINGQRWLRDSMLRALPDVTALHEARGPHCFVRTVSTRERAEELLAALEQAYAAYVAREGAELDRPLGLFVFPDGAAFQDYCARNGFERYQKASGFANTGEEFAVSFEQAALVKTAVHEGAHLYQAMAFASHLPSWYQEGFACAFGHDASMTWDGKKLITLRPPTAAAVAPLRDDARRLPLGDLLQGSAVDTIQKGPEAAAVFYLQSWAFLWFLRTTKDARFQARFADWESFCLGAGYDEQTQSGDAARLFDQMFGGVAEALEGVFVDWLRELE